MRGWKGKGVLLSSFSSFFLLKWVQDAVMFQGFGGASRQGDMVEVLPRRGGKGKEREI